MRSLPWMKWFPGDWVKDTRMLTLAAKGAWTDILMALHGSATYGQLSLPIESWARVIGANSDETGAVLRELQNTSVADVVTLGNGYVTVKCRRMIHEENIREKTRQRVARHRDKSSTTEGDTLQFTLSNEGCNGSDTHQLRGRGQRSEARDQKNTVGRAGALPDSDWLNSLKQDPGYAGIDIDREYAKCVRWCETNRKPAPSRKRVINWLNRAEPSLPATSHASAFVEPTSQRRPLL